MSGPSHTVSVDEQLQWVVTLPTLPPGAARPFSPEQSALTRRHFDSWMVQPDVGERHDLLVETIALTVLAALHEPPELPFIGEPFGGEDATD